MVKCGLVFPVASLPPVAYLSSLPPTSARPLFGRPSALPPSTQAEVSGVCVAGGQVECVWQAGRWSVCGRRAGGMFVRELYIVDTYMKYLCVYTNLSSPPFPLSLLSSPCLPPSLNSPPLTSLPLPSLPLPPPPIRH